MKNNFVVSLMLIFITGCSLEPPEWAKPKASGDVKDIKIGLSISTLNNPFFVSLKDGVVAEATKQGMEVVVVDAQNDSAKQSNDVDDLIQQGVNALLINPTDSSAISTVVQTANSLGIPVITLDRSADQGEVSRWLPLITSRAVRWRPSTWWISWAKIRRSSSSKAFRVLPRPANAARASMISQMS